MDLEDAKNLLEDRYKVKAEIEKDPMFVGYDITLSYIGYIRDEQRRKEAKFYEVDLSNFEQWMEENDKAIREKLSIL